MNIRSGFCYAILGWLFSSLTAFGQATLNAPAQAGIGEEVLVTYTGPAIATTTMTLGLPNGQELLGANPAELSGEASGSVNLLMPDVPGTFLILYLDGRTILASREILVTPIRVTLEAPRTAVVGSIVKVAWAGPNDEGDVIILHKPNEAALSTTAPGGSGKKGVAEIAAPTVAGVYQFAYISDGDVLGTLPLEVTGSAADPVVSTLGVIEEVPANYAFEVTWKGPADPRDRLVLVSPATPEVVLSYTFLDPTSPTAVLRSAANPGTYEVQYRTATGVVLSRQPVIVSAAPSELGELAVIAEATSNFSEGSAISVILDASGSMLKDIAGEDRIDLAKDTLLNFMKESIPAGTPFSLRAFGHIEEGSCQSELLIPLAPFDYVGMSPIVRDIEAINLAKTPIADSLAKVASDLDGVVGQRTVVLLTDGEETCGGNPAVAIRQLRAAGIDIRVNIIGFAIENSEWRENFESWAALGRGKYFDAPKADQLSIALRGAVAIPYGVYQNNRLVATGVTGNTTHQLAPGDYTLLWKQNGVEVRKPVVVASSAVTEVLIP